jgi:ElaB/YqjD/DUF883 family membrane-anchored ribosome-binding protein
MSMETDRIEADLQQSRHRLNDTLEALGQRLSPGQMVDEVMGLAQGQAGDFAKKLGNQVKENPLPTLLIAAGVGMLLLNRNQSSGGHSIDADDWHHERRYRSLEEARWSTPRNTGESDSDYEDRVHQVYAKTLDLKQKAGEAVHEFKARVSKTVEGVKANAEGARERMAHALSDAKHSVQDQARKLGQTAVNARHSAENMYEETPLAAGAIALAVGALIGASAPLSRPEREALSGVADKAVGKGADLAERGARMVEDRVDGALH